jgi:hypothetical protein
MGPKSVPPFRGGCAGKFPASCWVVTRPSASFLLSGGVTRRLFSAIHLSLPILFRGKTIHPPTQEPHPINAGLSEATKRPPSEEACNCVSCLESIIP